MTIPWLDLGFAALLVCAFAALGVLLLRRWPRDAFGWNASFLAGAATCAAALFPLSVALPGTALAATGVVLGVALVAVAGWRLRKAPADTLPRRPAAKNALSVTLFVAVAAVAMVYVVLDLRYRFFWDGFQIWASKAQMLSVGGDLSRSWYAGESYDRRLLAYPPLVPMLEALFARLRGAFDFDALKPVFLVFYLSLLVSTYAAARSRLSEPAALLATLVVSLVPGLSTAYAAGGYADLPLAAVVAGAVAAAFRAEDARALPWTIGAMTVVKNEGLLLAAAACLAVAAFWILPGVRSAAARAVGHWRGITVVGAFVAVRFAYLAWLRDADTTFRSLLAPGSLAESRRRILHVARISVESMLDVSQWGVLWPAFAIAGIFLLARGCARERCLAAAVALGLAADSAIFLQTNWPLELHVAQAMPRLLSQLSPAAVLAVMFAAARALRGARPSYDPVEVR